MAIRITARNAGDLKTGAPLLAHCISNGAAGVFGGPCKEPGGHIVTLRDYIIDCVRDGFDNAAMDYGGIDDIEFDLHTPPADCFFLTREAAGDGQKYFRWRYKWNNVDKIPIRNDTQQRSIPEGAFPRFLGQTVRCKTPSGDRHALTGFLMEGVYDRLACLLIHEIRFAKVGKSKMKRRAAFFVGPEQA